MIPIFVIKSNAKDKNEKNATNRLVWKREIHISTNPKCNLFFISLFSHKKRLFSPLWQRSPSHHYHQTLTSPFLPHRLTSFLWRESGEFKVFFLMSFELISLSLSFSPHPQRLTLLMWIIWIKIWNSQRYLVWFSSLFFCPPYLSAPHPPLHPTSIVLEPFHWMVWVVL